MPHPALLLLPIVFLQPAQDREPQDLKRLLQELRWEKRGALAVVDPSGEGRMEARLKALLEEDVLLEQLLPFKTLPFKGAGQELATREGWGPEPRWVLLDAKGKVRATDTTLGTAQALADAVQAGGWIHPGRALETLLARSPGHTAAKEELLAVRLQVAMARMRPFLQEQPSRKQDEPRAFTLLRPLTEAEDSRIWGPSATALDRLMADPQAQGRRDFLPLEARFSPLMQRTARTHLKAVESRVVLAPGRIEPWQTWIRVATCAERLDLGPLQEACLALPGAPMPLPPQAMLDDLVEAFRHLEAWGPLRDFLRAWVIRERDPGSEEHRHMRTYAQFWFNKVPGPWKGQHGPLLEAYLRLGETLPADALVEELETRQAYGSVYELAAGVADQCGKPDLAQTWRDKAARKASPGEKK